MLYARYIYWLGKYGASCNTVRGHRYVIWRPDSYILYTPPWDFSIAIQLKKNEEFVFSDIVYMPTSFSVYLFLYLSGVYACNTEDRMFHLDEGAANIRVGGNHELDLNSEQTH